MTSLENTLDPHIALDNFEHGINRLAVSTDGRYLATSDVDMNVEVMVGDMAVFHRNFGSDSDKIRPMERIRGLVFSANADFLYVAAGDKVTAVRTSTWHTEWGYEAPRSFGFLIISPICLDTSVNGDVAATFDNGSIVVWDAIGNKKASWKDNDAPKWMRFSPDGLKLVGSDSFGVCTWDVEKKKRTSKIGPTPKIFGLDLDPEGSIAATRTLRDIVLWDLTTKDPITVVPVRPGAPLLAFHREYRWLAYTEQNRIKIVDVDGVVLNRFELDVASALSLSFSADGAELLVGCTEHQLIRLPI